MARATLLDGTTRVYRPGDNLGGVRLRSIEFTAADYAWGDGTALQWGAWAHSVMVHLVPSSSSDA